MGNRYGVLSVRKKIKMLVMLFTRNAFVEKQYLLSDSRMGNQYGVLNVRRKITMPVMLLPGNVHRLGAMFNQAILNTKDIVCTVLHICFRINLFLKITKRRKG